MQTLLQVYKAWGTSALHSCSSHMRIPFPRLLRQVGAAQHCRHAPTSCKHACQANSQAPGCWATSDHSGGSNNSNNRWCTSCP